MKKTASTLAVASFALCSFIVTSLPASAQEENLAKGLQAITDSTSAGSNLSIKNLTDDSDYSVWKGSVPAKLDFDLGEAKLITRVDLHIPPQYVTGRNQELSIEISQDGEKFEGVVDPEARAFTHGNKGRVSLPIDKNARYVRIIIESNDQDEGEAMLSEVRIY